METNYRVSYGRVERAVLIDDIADILEHRGDSQNL
jgi:hypothetical protein